MNSRDNHFALFGLPERFALDVALLDDAYRRVQGEVHPDRFARGSAGEKRVAMEWATRANEAYRALRDPLRRATYLCTLRGVDPADERDTAMRPDFLMQQLDWREALDDARANGDAAAAAAVRTGLDAARAAREADVEAALDRDDDLPKAVAAVREWMFLERLGETLSDTAEAAAH